MLGCEKLTTELTPALLQAVATTGDFMGNNDGSSINKGDLNRI